MNECSKVVVIDANKLMASAMPDCESLVKEEKKISVTKIRLRNLFNYWQVCFFVPERMLRIVPVKIKERCLEIAKSKGIMDMEKVEEFAEKTVNTLLEFLEEIEVVKVPESKYKRYLSNSLAKLAKDANDDNHLIATALYLKSKLKLEKIYILTNDNKFLEIKGLSNTGIVPVKEENDLEDWNL